MRINSVPDVECFYDNKMRYVHKHFVHHPVDLPRAHLENTNTLMARVLFGGRVNEHCPPYTAYLICTPYTFIYKYSSNIGRFLTKGYTMPVYSV